MAEQQKAFNPDQAAMDAVSSIQAIMALGKIGAQKSAQIQDIIADTIRAALSHAEGEAGSDPCQRDIKKAQGKIIIRDNSKETSVVWTEKRWIEENVPNTAPQVAVPEGYTLVPVEMTDEIRNAIYMALHYDMSVMNPDEWGAVDKAYAAMLAAAPTVPTDEQPVSDPDEQGLREAHYQGFVSGEYTGRTGEGNSDDAWAEFISDMRGVQPDPAPDEREIVALRKDAERYRWLREKDNFPGDEGDGETLWDQLCDVECDEFDEFIDRLRAGKEGE